MKNWISYVLIAMVVVMLMRLANGDGQRAGEAVVSFGSIALFLCVIYGIVTVVKHFLKK